MFKVVFQKLSFKSGYNILDGSVRFDATQASKSKKRVGNGF